MSAFSDAVQDYFAARAGLPIGDFGDRVNDLLDRIREVGPEEASWPMGGLVEVLARSSKPPVSVLGVIGELLCRGASFWGVLPHYVAGIRYHLAHAAEIEQAARSTLSSGQRLADLPREQAQAILEALPEAAQGHVESWNNLGFFLGSAAPILEQVKPMRQLARAIGVDAGWIRDSGLGPDWLARLPDVLDGQAASDGPLPDPDGAIDSVLTQLRQAAGQPPRTDKSMEQLVQSLYSATTVVPPEAFARAATELARVAATADPAWASELARMSGAFIERGANPEPGVDALLAGLPRLLDPLVAFVEACRERATEEEEGSPVENHGEAVAEEMPEAQRALDVIGPYCLGTIAHLARCPAARLRHGRNADLLARLNAVRWDTNDTGYLWKMLQVLEEELVILAPALGMGWRVKIGGVGDNFQLHALISGLLVGPRKDGKYPGRVSTHDQEPEPGPGIPLKPRATATQLNAPCAGREPGFTSRIQLWNWTALQGDGTLPADPIKAHDHFIWNEGVPADILPFEGTRIVLLGDSTIQRNWNGGRLFPFMEATFEIVETMDPAAARGWLDRIARQSKSGNPE